MTFIYALRDPDDQTIRYVGKADSLEKRLQCHLRESSLKYHTRKNCWIKSLLSQSKKPVITILEIVNDAEWQARERYWIAILQEQGANLTNGTRGGDGLCNPSIDVRERIAAGHRGKPLTLEHRAKIAQGNRGKQLSEKQRQVLARPKPPEWIIKAGQVSSKLRCGKPLPEEWRQKISVANTGRVMSEETKMKISNANRGNTYNRGRLLSDDHKTKISKAKQGNTARKGQACSIDHKKKLSVSLKLYHERKRQQLNGNSI